MEYAINLCEIIPTNVDKKWLSNMVDSIKIKEGSKKYSRIYIGSYFCDSYFLKLSKNDFKVITEWIKENDLSATLVIPMCMEQSLQLCKKALEGFIGDIPEIDEIVVNDVGMAEYVGRYGKKTSLGRLFMKETRDPRNKDRVNISNAEYCWNNYYKMICEEFGITGMEADLIHSKMDYSGVPKKFTVTCHRPYAYITTGHICPMRSINKTGMSKFTVDTDCKMECYGKETFYNVDKSLFLKYGKTCYFPGYPSELEFEGQVRDLYWPVDELVKK